MAPVAHAFSRHLRRCGPGDGVAYERVECVAEQPVVGIDRHRRGVLEALRDAAAVVAYTGDHLFHEEVEAQRAGAEGHLAGFETGQFEELVDPSSGTRCRVKDLRERFPIRRCVPITKERLRGRGPDGGERRAHLVRGIGDELSLLALRPSGRAQGSPSEPPTREGGKEPAAETGERDGTSGVALTS